MVARKLKPFIYNSKYDHNLICITQENDARERDDSPQGPYLCVISESDWCETTWKFRNASNLICWEKKENAY